MSLFQITKRIVLNYSKVVDNYFSMTFIHGATLIINLLLYPYLIRILGQTAYGSYVFAFSVISFFILFITFGFTFPALKQVSLHPNDWKVKNEITSTVFTAKFLLFILSSCVLVVLISFIPFFRNAYLLYLIVFSVIISEVIFPVWYFQGIQKMRIVTYIQVGSKLLSIPFIFIFIKSAGDLLLYAVIISVSTNLAAVVSILYLKKKENIGLHFVSLEKLKALFKDALPFFWTSAMGTVKKETVTLVIGVFFGMKDVALYDLANKLVNIPRLLTQNINTAIFPKIIGNAQPDKIKKIIRYESFISLGIIALIIAFGYWAVLLLGGREMTAAYPLAVLLSTIIYSWLIVGCYINYIFVPQNKYYFAMKNQLVALLSFLVLGGIFLLIHKSLILIVLAYILSGIIEIFYCRYLVKKYQLL
jgi:PST family polysaccharide transporter